MAYILCLLIIIIIFLAVRLIILRHEINRISMALEKLNASPKNGKLTVATMYKPLENLCSRINHGLEIRDKACVDTENHEAELRAQISNISHDLRTPLTAILGYISLSRSAPEKTADYLKIIEDRSKALQALIEQFYELSIIEDSYADLTIEPIDITAAVTNCILGHYALFEKKGIQPEYHLPEQALMIFGNTRALERILQNLTQNALRFANQSISISLSDEGEYCAFKISNDAENLTNADINRLFERFYTADKSRSDGNTGLGLYIVMRLLEKIHGRVNNVVLENSLFTIEIFLKKKPPGCDIPL